MRSHDYDKSKVIYEQAMDVIHGYVNDAVDGVEELSVLVEELISEQSRDKADELISKILTSLEKIG